MLKTIIFAQKSSFPTKFLIFEGLKRSSYFFNVDGSFFLRNDVLDVLKDLCFEISITDWWLFGLQSTPGSFKWINIRNRVDIQLLEGRKFYLRNWV